MRGNGSAPYCINMTEYNTPPSGTAAPSASPVDWKERARLSLEQQWTLAQDLLTLGRRILSRYAGQTQRPTSLAQALPPDAPLVDQIPEPALPWEG